MLPRARCNPAWFTSLMLKKRVAALDGEVRADYVTAAKQSVLDYILLEVRSWWWLELQMKGSFTITEKVPWVDVLLA